MSFQVELIDLGRYQAHEVNMDTDPLSGLLGQPQEYRPNNDFSYDVAQLRYHNNRQKDIIRQLMDFEPNYYES